MRGAAISRLNSELNVTKIDLASSRKEVVELRRKQEELSEQLERKLAELAACKQRGQELDSKIKDQESSIGQLRSELMVATNDLRASQAFVATKSKELEAANGLVSSARAEHSAELERKLAELAACKQRGQELDTKIKEQESSIGQLRSELMVAANDLRASQAFVSETKEVENKTNFIASSVPKSTEIANGNEKISTKKSDAVASLQAAFGTSIPLATASDKDDLKKIVGIGPFIEEKLNNLGIFTFEQISLFDNKLSEVVTDAIEFFPGRIERDNWVGQARVLFEQKGN